MALPIEILEIVLSKSSVKSLLRFKTVCMSWNILISDPVFVRKHHLRQLQSKDSENLFLVKNSEVNSQGFSLVKLEKGRKIQTLQQVFGPYLWATVLCFCEGLILICDLSKDNFALWNPSTRTHTIFKATFYCGDAAFGICHDPITDDFKVVIAKSYDYSVYSCNNNSWTMLEKKYETKYNDYSVEYELGVCVEGTSYWASADELQIVYYDPRDDKFKILHMPENMDYRRSEFGKSIYLVDLSGFLCLYYEGRDKTVVIWRKGKGIENHTWSELMTIENMEEPLRWFEPKYLLGNKIVIRIKETNHSGRLVVYSPCKKRFQEFKDTKMVFGWLGFVPYMDTLFFPVEKSGRIVTGEFGFPIEKSIPERKRKRKCIQ
ncbi:PREDICTED: probable F-box protein At5g47300 [Erythranthe guttata]|uniref:probable F-box protein At5g47300 n=1 Tax=Erythranthe guttata TaxID=4155 RepID=UPI00064D7829|nr:PREDICTED: probable F-box protein At5g47300 [Erythranthe guttata]|eukprot:XP_012844266.1 PREDICTED: probable F-box protein At5g47300 [Erythranthe guttata]